MPSHTTYRLSPLQSGSEQVELLAREAQRQQELSSQFLEAKALDLEAKVPRAGEHTRRDHKSQTPGAKRRQAISSREITV